MAGLPAAGRCRRACALERRGHRRDCLRARASAGSVTDPRLPGRPPLVRAAAADGCAQQLQRLGEAARRSDFVTGPGAPDHGGGRAGASDGSCEFEQFGRGRRSPVRSTAQSYRGRGIGRRRGVAGDRAGVHHDPVRPISAGRGRQSRRRAVPPNAAAGAEGIPTASPRRSGIARSRSCASDVLGGGRSRRTTCCLGSRAAHDARLWRSIVHAGPLRPRPRCRWSPTGHRGRRCRAVRL